MSVALTSDQQLRLVEPRTGGPASSRPTPPEEESGHEWTQFLRAQRLDSVGSMASGIAHDLNNIFTPIVLAAGVLEGMLAGQSPDNVTALRLVSTIKESAERGGSLVKQILSFTRGHAQPKGPLELEPMLAEVVALIEQTFPKNIRLETVIFGPLGLIEASATQLHQVLLNLCVNARDAMPQGGVLRIEAASAVLPPPLKSARAGRWIRLTISDTGAGIPEEVHDRIFEPFFTTKPPGEGTGLGLHTVRTIVQEHGGFIEVTTEAGRGTQFHIFWPAVDGPQKSPAGPTQPGSAAPVVHSAAPPSLHRCGRFATILLVDDERGILEMTEALLKRHRYQVIAACGGPQALAVLSERKVDLVIIDIVMPLLDGPATIAAFQNIHPELPVIAMSGLADNRTRVEGLRNTRFLLKPFTPEQLLDIVAAAL